MIFAERRLLKMANSFLSHFIVALVLLELGWLVRVVGAKVWPRTERLSGPGTADSTTTQRFTYHVHSFDLAVQRDIARIAEAVVGYVTHVRTAEPASAGEVVVTEDVRPGTVVGGNAGNDRIDDDFERSTGGFERPGGDREVRNVQIVDRLSIASSIKETVVGELSVRTASPNLLYLQRIALSGRFWRADIVEAMARLQKADIVERRLNSTRRGDYCMVTLRCVFDARMQPTLDRPVNGTRIEWSPSLFPMCAAPEPVDIQVDKGSDPIRLTILMGKQNGAT